MTTSDFLFLMSGICAGVVIGDYLANLKWQSNAKKVMRISNGGNFYWVIKDGDEEKLNHVMACFDDLTVRLVEK